MFKLRETPSFKMSFVASSFTVLVFFMTWYFSTIGSPENRMVSPAVIGSPSEVVNSFHSLWFDRALTRNVVISLQRLLEGFGLAALVGVPLGILCGAWPLLNSAMAPISVFLRNVPMSAILPLTLLWFGIGEEGKVMFIFMACVCFVMFDTVRSVSEVNEQYVQAARTLGASDLQILFKVLIPNAMPNIFGSLRLLFGLAFGYIVLAELVNLSGGVGSLILVSQRQGPRDHVYLILVVIAILAYLIDCVLCSIQSYLFPYRVQK
jgi:ABC-type nitrate/sulfonate/bicarbonate transport system permease component